MKNVLKTILKYLIIFIGLLAILLTVLCLTMKIPKEAIEDNLKESANFLKDKRMVYEMQMRREYTYLDYRAESLILNIIYNVDTNDVIKSAMLDNYYESAKANAVEDFVSMMEKQQDANTPYLRYWHGSMIFLRPLLVFFSLQQIYIINYIVIMALAVALLIILLKKNKILALIYIISMIMIAFPIVGVSIEYSSTFYIMLISSIIAVLIEKNGDSGLFKLLFINGMLTCFFDFLTTEIITLFVPVLFVLFIRKEENKEFKFKDGFIFVFKACIAWAIAYLSMWGAKWLLSSIILNINAMEYVTDNLKLRINGVDGFVSLKEMYHMSIPRNFEAIYPFCNIKGEARRLRLFIILAIIIALMIDWKNIKDKKYSLLMLMIAIMPYTRYMVLVNHSYKHAFFTYREQIITLIAFGMIMLDCFNAKIWTKDIKILKKNKQTKENNN